MRERDTVLVHIAYWSESKDGEMGMWQKRAVVSAGCSLRRSLEHDPPLPPRGESYFPDPHAHYAGLIRERKEMQGDMGRSC